ncbi:MAG: SLC13 family permease [Nitriliruptor sp.]|nr:MAG: SLC13 family permease [Nitriliruptor sp.]TVR20049.1 MAG: SLC13 family permease [Nitriliruptor sp.]
MDDHSAWITGAVLVVLLVALARERVPPAAGILAAVLALVLTGVLEVTEAFAGFANPATLTVAGLFVVARALREHTDLEGLLTLMLRGARSERGRLLRLTLPTAGLSAAMANTPLVAAAAPIVRTWAERSGRPPSRYLIPLSFAAILGGMLTTIGTSPTLLVSGLVERETGTPFRLFEVTPVSLPVVVVALTALCVFGPRLLPDRSSSEQLVIADERAYTLPLQVEPGGAVDGLTVSAAGLRELESAFLARIHRDDTDIAPVGPEEVLRGGDVLVLVGEVADVTDLAERDGLRLADSTQVHLLDGGQHDRYEVVLDRASPLAGRTLKEMSFRGRYDAAVLALHRGGQRVHHKLGTEVLEPGDSLLVQAAPGFDDRWRDRGDFAVVVPLTSRTRTPSPRRWFVLGVVLAMLVIAGSGLLPILTAVLVACAALVATRTVSFHAAKASIDLDVVLIIGAAIGLGTAVTASGLATTGAQALVGAVSGQGAVTFALAVLGLIVTTLVLTELITNIAAAALMTPIALDLALQLDADPRRLAIAVAIAASASFLTPIGYQTNTIVYGLGGYRFGDYWRVGLPLSVAVTVTTVAVLTLTA